MYQQKCITCTYLKTGNTHTFKNTGLEFKIKHNFSCSSKNVIYVLICANCSKEYIGQTSCLKDRLTVHRQHIRDSRLRILDVSKHLHNCSKGRFQAFPFYQMNSNNKIEREIKEQFFIDKMRPDLNCL